MFDLFKKAEVPQDIKAIRNAVVLFIKDQLKRAEGGEGGNIKGLQLYLAPTVEDKHLYEAAVYFGEEPKFKNEEVQRIADDYAIDLPENWTFETIFTDDLPAESLKAKNIPAGLFISTRSHNAIAKPVDAILRVLSGNAEQEQYSITPKSGKVCIGRDKRSQTGEGFIRENTIAFPSGGDNDSNKFISRQHAHIEWNDQENCYYLYADEGGIPPRNKVKVQTAKGEQIRLQSKEIGHQLEPGDQIVLGQSALLEFNYDQANNT
jgi:hypothetical protein